MNIAKLWLITTTISVCFYAEAIAKELPKPYRGDGRQEVVQEYIPPNNGGPDCDPCLGSGTR